MSVALVMSVHLLHKYTVAQVSVITRIIISLPSRGGNYLVRTICGRILDEVSAKCQCEHFLCHNEFLMALIKIILLHSNLLVFIQSSRLVYESLLFLILLIWQISAIFSLIIIVHSEVSKRNELFIAVDLYDSRNLYISYLLILLSALLKVISLNSRIIALLLLLFQYSIMFIWYYSFNLFIMFQKK